MMMGPDDPDKAANTTVVVESPIASGSEDSTSDNEPASPKPVRPVRKAAAAALAKFARAKGAKDDQDASTHALQPGTVSAGLPGATTDSDTVVVGAGNEPNTPDQAATSGKEHDGGQETPCGDESTQSSQEEATSVPYTMEEIRTGTSWFWF